MKIMFKAMAMAIASAVCCAEPGVAVPLKVVSESAALYQKKDGNKKLQIIPGRSLKAGTVVEGGERTGLYWAVTASSETYFLHIKDVRNVPSAPLFEFRRPDSVSDSRSRSAVMGVRGLTVSDSAAEASDVRPNLRAVYKLEDRVSTVKMQAALSEAVLSEIMAVSGLDRD